jgi:glycosyltransferase involved in cell wall biosynthesis
LAKRNKTPYILQFIGSDINIDIDYYKKIANFNNALLGSNSIIFESKSLLIEFQKHYPTYNKTHVYYRGVELENYKFKNGILNEIRFLFLGGMPGNSNIKGGFTLMKAILLLNENIIKSPIRFVLGGPNLPEFDSFIKKITNANISFSIINAVSKHEASQQLEKSNVVIIPSLYEGLPNLLYEGMASGNFVIASRVGGIPEIIEDGINGILITPNSPEILADAILNANQNC